MNIEDRVRDAYTLIDDRGPAIAPPLRHSVRRPTRRRVLRFAAPLTVAATLTAGLLITGVMNSTPGDRPQKSPNSSAGSDPSGMSPIAMVMQPSRDDQVGIYLCGRMSSTPSCHKQAATLAELAAIVGDLKKHPEVLGSTYVSMKQAIIEAKKRFADMPGFSNTVQLGDIPNSFRVTVRRPADTQSIVKAFTGRPGVDVVLVRRVG